MFSISHILGLDEPADSTLPATVEPTTTLQHASMLTPEPRTLRTTLAHPSMLPPILEPSASALQATLEPAAAQHHMYTPMPPTMSEPAAPMLNATATTLQQPPCWRYPRLPFRHVAPKRPVPLVRAMHPDARMGRFAQPLQPSQLSASVQPYVPPRTRSNNNWAQGVFKQWVTSRNLHSCTTELCPENLLEVSYPLPMIDYWLAAFVLEVRRADGHYYPGSTLKNILAALYRVMKQNQGPHLPSFVEKSLREKFFPQLHNALDRHLRHLRESGIGVER